jgi:hypothetical protein
MPDELGRTIRERAEAAGIPVAEFFELETKRLAQRLSWEEIETRIKARGPSGISTEENVRMIRELRGD